MLTVLAFFSGDKPLAVNLARWIETLGGVSTHDCLLVVDKSTDSSGVIEPLCRAFKTVKETSSEPAGAQGTWGNGTTDATAANEMWITAGNYVYHMLRRPWMWIESDAVPLRPTWLDEIESEYQRARKPFMGAYVNIKPHEPHMSGNGVYPACVADHSMDMAIPNKIAWDYAGRRDTIGKKKAQFTTLIQHEYRVHGKEPTFPTKESLSIILPGTAVFHRCKDETLIDRLREIREEKKGAAGIAEKLVGQPENSLAAENTELRNRIERLEQLLQKGGDAELNHACAPQPASTVDRSNAASKVPSPDAAKRGKQMKPKRQMSEATKAKLRASWEKRKAAKV